MTKIDSQLTKINLRFDNAHQSPKKIFFKVLTAIKFKSFQRT